MTENNEPMVEFPLTHPPTRLFAYVNSHPNDQVMGVVMDGRTGKIVEATILPTKQRVMLGLGVGNDKAHAHHTYRRLYPRGYRLIWTDDPAEDKRLESLKHKLEHGAGELREVGVDVTESQSQPDSTQHQAVEGSLGFTGQLTAELIRGGVEKEKSAEQRNKISSFTADSNRTTDPAPIVPEQPDASDTDTERGDPPPVEPTLGGFF